MQSDLFDSGSAAHSHQIALPDAELIYITRYLSNQSSDSLFQALINTLQFEQHPLKVYNKNYLTPRLVAWCADPGVVYRYSNTTLPIQPWPPELKTLKESLNTKLNTHFNGVLVNYYRDGNDKMGWHSDDEAALGSHPIIASISLGASRTFQLKHKTTKQRHDIELEDGSLLVMKGATQTHWQHCLPERKRVTLPRINLTFRTLY